MKVAKYLHSCLLVEEKGVAVLIDPGIYTYQEKVLNLDLIERVDYLLITHEHGDHFYIPLIKEVLTKFPEVKIISNSSVVGFLNKENIKAISAGNEFVQLKNMLHVRLLDSLAPENTVFTLFNKLTHPGDCISFDKTTDVLAMPIQAPWGSMVECCEKAVSLKPRVVIPIHDYHWRDEVREGIYKRLEIYFGKAGIRFLNPQSPGFEFEV